MVGSKSKSRGERWRGIARMGRNESEGVRTYEIEEGWGRGTCLRRASNPMKEAENGYSKSGSL